MDNILPILIPIIVTIFLLRAIKIAPENSYYAVIKLGKFAGFRGSGLHFKWTGSETQWIKFEVGDRGKITSKDSAKFGEIQLPVESEERNEIGSFVRITGVTDRAVEVVQDGDQTSTYVCEKCGHENQIK